MNERNSNNPGALRKALLWSALVWGLGPLFISVYWLVLVGILRGFGGLHQHFWLGMHSLTYTGGPMFWIWIFGCSLISLIIVQAVFMTSRSYEAGAGVGTGRIGVSVVTALLVAFGGFMAIHLAWQGPKNVARYYDQAATVYAPSFTNAPGSLEFLLQGAKKGTDGCALVAASDVPSCIKKGVLAKAGFDARVSSAAGAEIVMQRTSGSRQNVDLLSTSLTYLNGDGKNGVWAGIRDGFGPFQPTEGVVEWNGVKLPTECDFGGRGDKFNKAIRGVKSNSLVNYLTDRYPGVYWQQSDVWGYCNGTKPVLVLPVEEQKDYLSQVISVPAGVEIVTGSASGNPTVVYKKDAANLPGPVIAKSMYNTQEQAMNWMAGRAKENRSQFGFEPSNSRAQAGNNGDYLLRSAANGHMYWVTPLTLASSQSQLFVAFGIERADKVTAGKLNAFQLYALSASDPRTVNIDQLEAIARDFMVNNAGGFIPSGGKLIEFTPATGDTWRAFGEINGRVIYRLDISATGDVPPRLVSLDPSDGAVVANPTTTNAGTTSTGTKTSTAGIPAVCGKPVVSLTQKQIVACLQYFASHVS